MLLKKKPLRKQNKWLDIYADFAEEFMAMPVIKGFKTESERFAGAEETYCIEALMQDGKALQAGTSHFLGQNFAKAFDVKFTAQRWKARLCLGNFLGSFYPINGSANYDSSDDVGLVLPPKLAPNQVVIVPIYRSEEQFDLVSDVAKEVMKELRAKGIRVKFDNRDTHKPGWKFNEYELKGVPVRLAIGPRDVENGTLELARRDTLTKETISRNDVVTTVVELMDEIQSNLYNKAVGYRSKNTTEVNSYDEFKEVLNSKGGFILAHWDGTSGTEEKIKNETKATIRCIPLDAKEELGSCMVTGKPSTKKVLFAKAY